jgi:hypothetical protein
MFASIEMAKNGSRCQSKRIHFDQVNVNKMKIQHSNVSHQQNVDKITSHKSVVNQQSNGQSDEMSSKPTKVVAAQNVTFKGKSHFDTS